MRFRVAGGYERLQSPAGPLGQGTDANGEENPSQSFPLEVPMAREGRSVFPPHGEYFLSTDGGAVNDAAAGDDRAFLSGLVSDAGDRLAAVSRVDLLHLQFLSGGAARNSPENLVARDFVHAVCNGHGHWNLRAQCASGH